MCGQILIPLLLPVVAHLPVQVVSVVLQVVSVILAMAQGLLAPSLGGTVVGGKGDSMSLKYFERTHVFTS